MKTIITNIEGRTGIITLNRPEKRNALNQELVSELKGQLLAWQDEPSVKTIVIKGSGKAFCAGADLEYLQQLQKNTYEENLADSNHLKELFFMIYDYPKTIIACVQGHAIAGGCGLANVCDFTFSVPEAKFGYTEVKIGFVPAMVLVFLIRKIGEARAKELLLSGELITAERAEIIGIVNKVVDKDELGEYVLEFAEKLNNTNSGESISITKKMIHKVQNMTIDEALNYASEMNAKARATDDCKTGIDSFLSKKPLTW
ncbi:enoyl-CoA hydratase/isomerase family protein [Marinigracilibium pacificum]|uniref:Enoyl-CoA hydratase/isomerase family protein n=1 Tax=Marinigracilibium pacificum TaxID=2729599 RepID=A0A848J7E1_9BACT|nr:enoyl-CoA hydratase/isomerase family protein [Marinigracilibium pacificum]NMM49022.1 enoyl-CoA hydratase/isomerase family protein [Marinigracilibium pacificum]